MDFSYRIGLGQSENLVITLQVLLMIGKAFASEIVFFEFQVLDHRTHRAIHH